MAKNDSRTPNHSGLEFALDAKTLARVAEIIDATKPHLLSQADA
jgi:hypothetical protein